MSVEKLAVFVFQGGYVERRSGLHEAAYDLQRFVREDEFLQRLPETDWDILKGPEEIIGQYRLPLMDVRHLLREKRIRTVEIPQR